MRAGTFLTVLVTAIVTAALTSAFWMFLYSRPNAVPPNAAAPPKPDLVLGPSGLAIPVAGVRPEQITDTYTAARSGGRVHDASDIMAPAGTPVVAAAPGTLEKLFYSNGGGGITAYVRSPDGRYMFYYAHLKEYAPNLHEGQPIKQGDLIGKVGSTGDANAAAPHLHFAINRMEAGERWWQGTPINPYPLLAGNKAAH